MKALVVLVSMILAYSAQASDKKLGNVIAIEREVTNVYSSCLQAVGGDTEDSKTFFACALKYLKDGEINLTKARVINFKDENCTVHGEAIGGVTLITFGTNKSASTFEEASACLKKATDSQNSFKVLVYSIE